MWNRMGAERRSQNWGRIGSAPLGWPQEIRPSSFILPNFFVLGQTVQAWWRRSAWKNLTHRFQPFKVTQTYRIDTDRSTTFDFLLMFYSNHRLMLYRIRDKRRFQQISANGNFFTSSCVWRLRWEGSPCKAKQSKAKAKQRCVMGVGMCLYAQLVQTKNT